MIPGTDEYVQSLDKEVSAALVGQKTAKEALDSAANAWIEITAARGLETQKAAWNARVRSN